MKTQQILSKSVVIDSAKYGDVPEILFIQELNLLFLFI